MADSSDVVVVGAGVFGAWTAHQLRLTGRSVTLVDAFGAGHSRSSSGGESRIIRLSYGDKALYSRWARQSLAQWQTMFADARPSLFHKTGVLWLGRDGDDVFDATLATLGQLGVDIEVLPRAELDARFPQFDFDTIARAIYEPEGGVLLARRAVDVVVQQGIRRGIDYRVAAVQSIGSDGRIESVSLEDGSRLWADTFVFACGPWLPKLFTDELGARLRVTRQEVFFFGVGAGDRRFRPPAMPAWIDFRAGVYGIPDIEGRGTKVGLDEHGAIFDPDRGDRLPSASALYTARQLVAARLPVLRDAPLLEARVCQYTNTWDGNLLVDRHPAHDNVWLVGGGSGHGFKLGPAVGAYVAAHVDGNGTTEPELSYATKHATQARAVY